MTEATDVQHIRDRFELLLAAGLAISAEHSMDAVLRQVVASARSVVGARYAALGVIGDDRQTLMRFETSGLSDDERARIGPLPSGHGILGLLIRDARPVRIPRIGADSRRHGFPPNHPPMASFLGVPILGATEVFGNLYLTEKIGADEFTEEDERIAVLLAARAGSAINAARLIEQKEGLLGQLQALQRQRDQFFAMMNHELRNALTGVFGWAEQLRRAKNEAAVQRASREVHETAERTITLLNNLLDLSRLDAGKAEANFQDVRLGDVVARASSQVQPAADARRIELLRDMPSGDVGARTDPLKLEQIVINLLTNAVRHSPAGATITIRLEPLADEVLIHVVDHGPGIAADDQPRIFEPYVRVDPESGLGSGLGLPVCRRLAELLGGRLSVRSKLGNGATFTVALPLGGARS